jgi:16S rRNA (cytidine1402-2'-O)-methyltransferase
MNKSKGKLYIVPTPIGNLKDITYRAVEVLGNCDLIAAEDTRTSYRLLQEYSIKSEVISYHKYNEKARVKLILEKLDSGLNVAIISDAGTPGISDPAKIIVQAIGSFFYLAIFIIWISGKKITPICFVK